MTRCELRESRDFPPGADQNAGEQPWCTEIKVGGEFVCEELCNTPPHPPPPPPPPSATTPPFPLNTHTHSPPTHTLILHERTASRALLYRTENSTSKSCTSVIHSEVKKQVSCNSVHVGSFYTHRYLLNTSGALTQQGDSCQLAFVVARRLQFGSFGPLSAL